jgi:soluble lytic murein transglycosylase-like protein
MRIREVSMKKPDPWKVKIGEGFNIRPTWHKKFVWVFMLLSIFLIILCAFLQIQFVSLEMKYKVAMARVTTANKETESMIADTPYEVGLNAFKVAVYEEGNLPRKQILESIYGHAKRTGVSPFLGYRIMMAESAGNPSAISETGDYGLMQVNYKVHRVMRNVDFGRVLDVDYNIRLGFDIINECLKMSDGDVDLALKFYNGGGHKGDPKYVARVARAKHD